MKLKSILLTALAASTTLAACDKSESTDSAPVDKTPKGVTLTLPNIAPQVRATGDAMAAGSQVELSNFKVYFVKADGTAVTDEELTYEEGGAAQKTYFSNADEDWTEIAAAGKELTYHFLPYETAKVVVVGNIGDVAYSSLANMTEEAVPNDDTEAGHPLYQLYGQDDLTEGGAPDDAAHQNIYQASVTLEPRVSRFEIYGFEYKAAEAPATNKYAHVELQKIVLNNYYTQYNFVTKLPVESTKVSGAITEDSAWTWIQGQTDWCDALTLNLAPGEKKFVNGDAITDPDEDGEGATGIITYGLAHVADKANNPELLLSLYGVTEAGTKYPLYLHAKFVGTENPAFESGKIYRVFFSFSDTDIDQPQRCVELNVQVANWTVVAVTPEF